jgi:hypothetical protein
MVARTVTRRLAQVLGDNTRFSGEVAQPKSLEDPTTPVVTKEVLDYVINEVVVALNRCIVGAPRSIVPLDDCRLVAPGDGDAAMDGARVVAIELTATDAAAEGDIQLHLPGMLPLNRQELVRMLTDGATDKESVALSLFRFVREYLVHGPPVTDNRTKGVGCCNPLSILHNKGYAQCGNFAVCLAVLAHWAGLRSRIVSLTYHTVPELWWDDSWHYLDPDTGWYFRDDFGRILSLTEVCKNGAPLISATATPELRLAINRPYAHGYSNTKRHRIVQTGDSLAEGLEEACPGPLGFQLRHGLTYTLLTNAEGPVWSTGEILLGSNMTPAPMAYLLASWEMGPDGKAPSTTVTGMKATGDYLLAGEAGGRIVLESPLRHPLTGGTLEFRGELGGPEDALGLTLEGPNGRVDTRVPLAFAADPTLDLARLNGLSHDGTARIILDLPAGARLETLTVSLAGQVNPRATPSISDWHAFMSALASEPRVTSRFYVTGTASPATPPTPVSPDQGRLIYCGESLDLAWHDPEAPADTRYKLEAECLEGPGLPLPSRLDTFVRGTEHRIAVDELAALGAAGRFRWRVRRAVGPGVAPSSWSPWHEFLVSSAWRFYQRVHKRTEQRLAHPTLGSVIKDEPRFLQTGLEQFECLTDLGLRPTDSVVDYACGSLRLGAQLIPFLEAKRYTGLDIAPSFWKAGLERLDPAIQEARQPAFHVLNSHSMTQLAGKADWVVCMAVFNHIPPFEIHTAVRNVAAMSRKAVFFSFRAAQACCNMNPEQGHFSGGWAHTFSFFEELFNSCGFSTQQVTLPAGENAASYASADESSVPCFSVAWRNS